LVWNGKKKCFGKKKEDGVFGMIDLKRKSVVERRSVLERRKKMVFLK
jgi:hypothetical protein